MPSRSTAQGALVTLVVLSYSQKMLVNIKIPKTVGALLLCSVMSVQAQTAPQTIGYVPSTISAEARVFMQSLNKVDWEARIAPEPDDVVGWKQRRDAQVAVQVEEGRRVAAREEVTLNEVSLGGVPTVEILPRNWKDNRRVIVYTHGGAYTMASARSRLLAMPSLANVTGMRVISVDYTTAPVGDWQSIQAQALAVIEALLEQGYAMKHIAVLGDSAGGGLATSLVLKLRDRGLGTPGAVVLWSPWVDLTNEGDTAVTLRDADPILSYEYLLRNSALAFAKGLDLKDPRISPVYADFSRGFAPTLIQEGTRTIFLSTSVRLYRKLDEAGHQPVIDMYEGMPHVFQDAPIPEAAIAIRKSGEFIRKQLG